MPTSLVGDAGRMTFDDHEWAATRAWVAEQLPAGRSVRNWADLRGGWTSRMRRLELDDGTDLVLRSFVKPFFRLHAPGQTTIEAVVRQGVVTRLDVSPAERAREVVIAAPFKAPKAATP